jgi:hypothetical protein
LYENDILMNVGITLIDKFTPLPSDLINLVIRRRWKRKKFETKRPDYKL